MNHTNVPIYLLFNPIDVLKSLCKAGLPEGNIFDYTASKMLKFETKFKTEQKRKAIVERYKNYDKRKQEEEELHMLPPIRKKGQASTAKLDKKEDDKKKRGKSAKSNKSEKSRGKSKGKKGGKKK